MDRLLLLVCGLYNVLDLERCGLSCSEAEVLLSTKGLVFSTSVVRDFDLSIGPGRRRSRLGCSGLRLFVLNKCAVRDFDFRTELDLCR